MPKKTEIFFHLGLERTATTFLQKRIFPYLPDIYHIKRREYDNYEKIISETDKNKYLISNEISNNKLEAEIKNISKRFPDAKVILVLRRQDKWIASQYKRAVKKGYQHGINNFLDVDNDKGEWKTKHLLLYPFIQTIENNFHNSPLILFHHQLEYDAGEFVSSLLDFLGTEVSVKDLTLKPTHVSYSTKQLIIRRWISSRGIFREPNTASKSGVNFFLRLYKKFIRYIILNIALLIPGKLLKNKKFIPDAELSKIRKYFEEDWKKCLQYK